MDTISHFSRPAMICGGMIIALLLLGCGGGGSSPAPDVNPNVGAGWIRIDSVWSDTQSTTLGGTAFISPTWWRCCSGMASDTGVAVEWKNDTTGLSGQASQYVQNGCFLSSCWLSTHSWQATVPLMQGANQITLLASDPSGNVGVTSITLTPGTVYPSVFITSPVKNSFNVGLNASISATFNDTMNLASFNATTFRVTDSGYNVVSGTYSAGGSSISFTPSAALTPNSWYYVEIAAGVQNLQGNPLLQSYTWSFQTGPM